MSDEEKKEVNHRPVVNYRFSIDMSFLILFLLFASCAFTGNLHCGSCGFDRDYLGDALDK